MTTTIHPLSRRSASGTSSSEEPELIQGPCADSPDVWFSESLKDQILARSVCETCPFQAPCLTAALDYERTVAESSRWGIWAGTTPNQRANIARRKWRGTKGPKA